MLLAGVATVCVASGARAQTPAAGPKGSEEGATLSEIVVTATRRAESLKDVPMAVSVATGDQLQKLNLFNVKDVQQLAPGLEITNNSGRNNAAILRGIAFDPDSGTLPAVDVYFNEINLDAQTAFTSMYDLNQIEVLRGPQGLLRGRTAPAGAITIATRKPDLTGFSGYLQVTGTDHQASNLQGAINIPIIADKLAIRIAGLNDQNNVNDVRDWWSGKVSRNNTSSGRISIAFEPTSNLKSVLTYQHLHSRTRLFQQVVGTGNAFLPSGAGFPPSVSLIANGPPVGPKDRIGVQEGNPTYLTTTNLFTLQTDWDLGPNTLSLTAGHQDALLEQTPDLDSTNVLPNFVSGQHNQIAYHVNTAELRLQSNGEHFWNYMVGVSYHGNVTPVRVTQSNDQLLTGVFPAPGSFFPFYQRIPVDVAIEIPGTSETWSGFASSRFQFTDKLSLEVGARYTRFKIAQQSYLTVVANGATVLNNLATLPPEFAWRTRNYLTGGANLRYKINDDVSTYFSWGHSYRPGPAAVGVTAQLDPSLVVAKSETSDSFEVGVKGEFLDRRLLVNADVFHQRFQNYIGRTNDTINATDNLQGVGVPDSTLQLNWNGNVKSTGVEVDVTARPVRNWTVNVSGSWVHARYRNGQTPCNLFNANGSVLFNRPDLGVSLCPTNGRIAEAPDLHFSANTEYNFDSIGPLQPFVRALATYQPGFNSSQIAYHYPARTLVNLYAGVRGPEGKWELSAFARNLLNQQRITNISGSIGSQQTIVGNLIATPPFFVTSPGTPLSSGYRTVVTQTPREVGVSLTYRF
jgi:iron complex outermembrane receptor protein